MALAAAFRRDDDSENAPSSPTQWARWVAATATRHFCEEEPLLDWLDRHGDARGLERDAVDPRTDMTRFVTEKGRRFEAAATAYLARHHEVVRIAQTNQEARSREAVERTWNALAAGSEIVVQGVLWNPENETYGAPDLLVRSDVLHELFPTALTPVEAAEPAADLPGARWHYRVVDVKFTSLEPGSRDGAASESHLAYMAQVWIYTEALRRLQGHRTPSGYLLGRSAKIANERFPTALHALERVDLERTLRGGRTLRSVVGDALAWQRRVREEGDGWELLPAPSVEALRPNMRSREDAPWHGVKRHLAAQLADLTVIPRVTPERRRAAREDGVARWDEPGVTASRLGIRGARYEREVDAVLRANTAPGGAVVFPARITANEGEWRAAAPVEFYVDFETVSDLDDDFSAFPAAGGQPLIFMVGCGTLEASGDWQFEAFTANSLTEAEEARLLDAWLAHMESRCASAGVPLSEARLYHWSRAEPQALSIAYNSAARRHGTARWNGLPWYDLLERVVHAEPLGVRGAFGFGVKDVAKALHAAGLIRTSWGEGPADGLGAMVGAWWCSDEARRRGVSIREIDLMDEIESYNEVDCRVMGEILHLLRRAH